MSPISKRILVKRIFLISVLGIIFGFFAFSEHMKNKSIYADIDSKQGVIRQIKVLALGDSLTAGYGLSENMSFASQLEQALRLEGYDVIVKNAGISGDTSMGGLRRLAKEIESNPDIAIVELGVNDALKGFPASMTEKNLDEILSMLEDRGISVLFAGMQAPKGLSNLYTKQFEEIYEKLSKEHNVVFYPFFMKGVFDVSNSSDFLLSDGLHPNEEGVRIIVNNILPYMKKLLEPFTAQ